MKKIGNLILVTFVMISFSACVVKENTGTGIQGVEVTESGIAYVTFRVPDGTSVESILGSAIGSQNTIYYSGLTSNSQSGYAYWYRVDSGGLLSRIDNIYRYAPKAATSRLTGVESPPNWLILFSTPSEDEIFKPEDTKKLEDKYGIHLEL